MISHTPSQNKSYGLQLFKSLSGEGNGTPLQYSCLENPMDGGAWKAAVHGVAEGRTRLSDFTFTFHFPALEKEMVTHSSVLAWRIPRTGEPGGLPSMGSHDWSDLAAAANHCQLGKEQRMKQWSPKRPEKVNNQKRATLFSDYFVKGQSLFFKDCQHFLL